MKSISVNNFNHTFTNSNSLFRVTDSINLIWTSNEILIGSNQYRKIKDDFLINTILSLFELGLLGVFMIPFPSFLDRRTYIEQYFQCICEGLPVILTKVLCYHNLSLESVVLFRNPSIKAQCRSIPIKILALIQNRFALGSIINFFYLYWSALRNDPGSLDCLVWGAILFSVDCNWAFFETCRL